MQTVSHFGDLGDLLAAMASFDAIGGDLDLVLYPVRRGLVRDPFTPKKVAAIAPFLLMQPYIKQVRYASKPQGIVLDAWRKHPSFRNNNNNLAQVFADWARVARPDVNKPWLRVDEPRHVTDVIVHRSPRYTKQSTFPWESALSWYSDCMGMVGSTTEHMLFKHSFGDIPYIKTPTLVELARVIAGCELFIGNQSAPYWIATGLMKTTWLEQYKNARHNCYWERDKAFYDRLPPDYL
jgi:hypothetical protein